jgi:hypothetical protein
MKKLLLAAGLVLLCALPLQAQLATGTIYGMVTDESNAALAGASVALKGGGGTVSTTSGQDGRFRFLNLDPGTYEVTITLSGFTTVRRENILVTTGSNVDISMALKIATMEESLTVEAVTPVIDTKKTGTATTFTKDELDKVPNSRDPWALLRTVPGILMDRVNIAGNESGQQSNFAGKGALRADAVWSMDGVAITDMAAVGASPTYFDYDAFQEINISTGANDIRQATGGVGLNFVTKRGTNRLHGTVRGYYTADSLEASNVPDELANPAPQFRTAGIRPTTGDTANHIDSISDYGADLGGPIVKDKLWFWASYGKQDIRLVRSAGNLLDRTLLKDFNVKLNWQASSRDMLSVMWFRGAKQKFGRGGAAIGCAGCIEAPSATWNQDDNYPDNLPPGLWKIENNHVFTPNLFVTAKYAYYGTGFFLESVGPLDQQGGSSLRLGQTYGSAQSQYFLRPQHTANLDGSWFFNGFGGGHELKFGASWRMADGDAQTLLPGDMVYALDNSATDQRARLYREGNGKNRARYLGFYLGDSFTKDRLTVNVGVRFDRQWGEARPSETQPNTAFPNAVPGIVFAGYKTPFTWNDVTPRVGLTYALDESRKTLLRASFSRYASQLSTGEIGYMNPSASAGFVERRWNDLNGDHLVQPNEIRFDLPVLSSGNGFNPAAPTAVTSANRIDPDYKAPLATEAIVGLDRELLANMAMSMTYTYRRNTRQTMEDAIGLSRGDYTPGTPLTGQLADGTAYTVPIFIPNAALVTANGNGRILKNRPGYAQNYHGFELAAIKRLSGRWMARLAASYFSHTEDFDGEPVAYFGNPTRTDTDPMVQGGEVPVRSAGSGFGDVFYNAKWAVNLNAMYQLPWDLEIAANVFGRQGSSYPLFRNGVLGGQGTFRVLVSPEVDTFRLQDIWNMDLRMAKNVKVGRGNITVTADLFNIFNNNVELNRQRNAASALFIPGVGGYLTDNLSPRVVRFGARVTF